MNAPVGENPKYPYLACIVALVVLATGVAWVQADVRTAVAFYSSVLHEAAVHEDVYVQGITYTVIDGVVFRDSLQISGYAALPALRLAYEKTLARRNPLVSLAGNSPSDMRGAYDSLSHAQNELALIQEDDDIDRTAIREYLFPMEFLHSLPALEEARLTFLESGRDTDARRYEDAQRRAISTYAKDINEYRAAFVYFVPETMRPYSSGGVVITRDQTLAVIDSLVRGMEDTRHTFALRRSCVRGVRHECTPADLLFPEIESRNPATITTSAELMAQAVRTTLSRSQLNPDIASTTLPLLVVDDSSCLQGLPVSPIFLIAPERSFVSTTTGTSLFFVGDIRFTKSADFPTVPFMQFFADRDIPYIPNNPLLPYQCPYLAHDFGSAFAIQELSERIIAHPLSTYATGTLRTTLESLEQSLTPPTHILKESDAVTYVHSIISLAQEPGAPRTLRDEAAAMSLLFKDPTAGFSRAISWVAEVEMRNMHAARTHDLPVSLSPETLFYFRSGFILFFMAMNTSATGNTIAEFESVEIPAAEQPYTYFSELSRNPASVRTLTEAMGRYYNIHRNTNTLSP